MKRTIALLFLLLAAAAAAHAQLYDFTLYNYSGQDIDSVCLAPVDTGSWSDNLLDYYIFDGDYGDIELDTLTEDLCESSGIYEFDLLVGFDDGTELTWSDIDLLSVYEIYIYLDDDGEIQAEGY
jgi:hypothetical protein